MTTIQAVLTTANSIQKFMDCFFDQKEFEFIKQTLINHLKSTPEIVGELHFEEWIEGVGFQETPRMIEHRQKI